MTFSHQKILFKESGGSESVLVQHISEHIELLRKLSKVLAYCWTKNDSACSYFASLTAFINAFAVVLPKTAACMKSNYSM